MRQKQKLYLPYPGAESAYFSENLRKNDGRESEQGRSGKAHECVRFPVAIPARRSVAASRFASSLESQVNLIQGATRQGGTRHVIKGVH